MVLYARPGTFSPGGDSFMILLLFQVWPLVLDDLMKAVACKVLHQLISSGNKCWMQHARKVANNCPSFGFTEKNRKLFMISKLVATVVWQPPPQIQFAMPYWGKKNIFINSTLEDFRILWYNFFFFSPRNSDYYA